MVFSECPVIFQKDRNKNNSWFLHRITAIIMCSVIPARNSNEIKSKHIDIISKYIEKERIFAL